MFIAVRTGLEPVTPCVTGMYSNQLNLFRRFLSRLQCKGKADIWIVQAFRQKNCNYFLGGVILRIVGVFSLLLPTQI